MIKINFKHNLFHKFLLIFFSLFLLSFLSFAGQLQPATILKITDGDTFWVSIDSQKTKLRLLGIDTPEKYSGYKLKRDASGCGVSQKYMASLGKSATKYAKRLVKAGDTVQVDIRGYGYYGRALAMVYL
ncbi:MAG: thermonuclease family protein, partial [Candidatus Cloacimonetes bacterium]|nr:thermonuclease family protein [Candidatus Cloacimonadota bacterium]